MRKTDLPEVYDNLPVAVCIIDQERRILYANRAFSELIGVLNKNAGEERFGDTFGCIHALEDPQGCGVGDRCAECPVSLAVEDTFATGRENRDVEQRFSLERDGVRRDATVLASTTIVRIDNMDALLLCLQDITGRRNEEARCRAFYKNSAIGFYRTTPAGEIVQANPALVRMLGYDSFEQLAERNLSSEGFAPDYPRTEFAERLEREGTISGFESSWTLADGSRKWLQENAWLTRDADGRPLYYDGTVEDVTRLIETQDRYRRLYEDQQIITDIARILAGAHVENADVQFARVLETVGEYLGVDRVHIVPLSGENAPEYRIREWCASGISPWSDDNRSQVMDQCSWLMDRFDQEEPVQIPDITALPPGAASQLQTYLPHDARSLIYLPFPKNDNDLAGCLHCEVVREPREWIPREVGLLRVIAEMLMTSIIGLSASRRLRESEKKLRTVLENITDVVWSLSFPEFEPLFISPSAEGLYGLPVEVFHNAPMEWQELIHPEDRHTTESALTHLEAHGYAEREYRMVRPDGEIRWVRDRSHFVFDEAGDRVAISGIASDITERKTAQHKLEQTAWALRQRLKERDALAAVWKSWQERQSLDEFLQVAVGEIPAGFQQPSMISARITFGEQQFVSPRFFESSRMLSEDVRVNGERAGTVTVCSADEIAAFLEEEAALVKAIADHIGRAAENYRILGDLRLQSAALETAGSGIIICDARDSDLPATYVNTGFERLSGYSEAEFIGRNPRFLQGEDREQPGLIEIRAGIREHRECNAVVRNFSKNGMPFWIDLRITPVRNDDGVVTHYVGISSDVTDLIEMRQELLQNERRLRLSQEYAGIGTWDWEISTGNLFWSAEIARMLGFTQDFRAATYESFRQAVHPEDREAFEDAIAECLKTGNRYVKEFRCIRADGTVIWLLGAGNVTYDASGRPDHLLGIGQDITERKQRETEILRQQQFQKVLADSAADFVSVGAEELDTAIRTTLKRIGEFFEVDRSNIVLFSPDGATVTHTHEWRREGVVSIRDVVQQFPVHNAPWYKAQLVDRRLPIHIPDVEQLPPEVSHEQRLLRQFGIRAALTVPLLGTERVRGFLALDLQQPFTWSETQIEGLGIIAKVIADYLERLDDYGNLMQLKAESDVARQQSEAANRAKSEFLSSMSHELRTPLNAILGFSQLLCAADGLEDQHREFATEVVSAGNHLLSLVNEVLDLSRIEEGRVDLSIEPVSCESVVHGAVRLIEPYAKQYGIRLEIGEAHGLIMNADAVRAKQVLVNLFSNAIKYNKPGGSVSVACFRGDGTVHISVSDSGIGIPEEKIGELFTHFNRLGRETGDIEGAGIGLALSKRLVELMDGVIGAESVVGQGSTFWIELPESEESAKVSSAAATAAAEKAAAEAGAGDSEELEEQITVLYIEDNPGAIRLMEQMLITRKRYRLVAAHTGSLGIELAEAKPPEVMLVDINLPGFDGYEVLRRVRESEWGREIPVIAVSANAMELAVKRGENVGFTAYVTKPLDVASFLDTLDAITAGEAEGESGSAR